MIPAQAVEAAAKEIAEFAGTGANNWEWHVDGARDLLEAVAPHMLATAWEQGHLAGSAGKVLEDEYPHLELTSNPYRPAK